MGGEVGGHHLTGDLSLHHNNHAKTFFAIFKCFDVQIPTSNLENRHVFFLSHFKMVWGQSHSGPVKASHCHVYKASLKKKHFLKFQNSKLPECQMGSMRVHSYTEKCECRSGS